jgi:hypothetical protein
MKYYTIEPGEYPDDKNRKNNENEFFGNGWSVKKDGESYTFTFISGSLAGKLKEVTISEEDFIAAKTGKITFDELCIKYNVS